MHARTTAAATALVAAFGLAAPSPGAAQAAPPPALSTWAELTADGQPVATDASGAPLVTLRHETPWTGLPSHTGDGHHHQSAALVGAATSTLRAEVRASGIDANPANGVAFPDSHRGTANAGMRKVITVAAGTSGLANGAPLLVTLNIRLDGQLLAGMPPADGAGTDDGSAWYAVSGTSMSYYAQVDQALWACDPAGSCAWDTGDPLARFSTGAGLTQSLYRGPTAGAGAPADRWVNHNASYEVETNTLGYQFTPLAYEALNDQGQRHSHEQRDVDLGLLSFQFLTEVGANLWVDANLSLAVVATGGDAAARAETLFGNTADLEFRAAPGIVFLGETTGVTNWDGTVSAVPEPASALLLAAGGLLLAARRRWGAQAEPSR